MLIKRFNLDIVRFLRFDSRAVSQQLILSSIQYPASRIKYPESHRITLIYLLISNIQFLIPSILGYWDIWTNFNLLSLVLRSIPFNLR